MRYSSRNPVEVTARAIANSKGDRAWRNYLGAAKAAEQVLQGPVNECLSRVFSSPCTLSGVPADSDDSKSIR
jgi:hypothetical protein